MTLDIIVPRYKEPWEVCHYLFDTIVAQRGVPLDLIHVYVVNDGKDVLDKSVFDGYPYKIDYLVKEHNGVSAARNYGLKQSDADYVMFCDIDDGFLSNYGLHLVFSAMQEGFDFIYSNFVEETFDVNGNATIMRHDSDLTFMHGKAYKRSFLLDNNILFDERMTIHEDGYFNMVAYVEAKNKGKIKRIDTPFYLWRWNDNSVVRSNRQDFVLKTYEHVMLTRTGICEQLKKRGYKEEYVEAVCMTVLNSYYDFQKTSYHKPQNAKYLQTAKKEFKKFYQRYKTTFNNCTNQKIAELMVAARNTAVQNGMLIEQQDLKSFLWHIEYEV